ncbi:TPA: hypothetical protein RQN23_002880 [Aeromonas veronii]|nr:hypothetical protein [Aeromonas veronii]
MNIDQILNAKPVSIENPVDNQTSETVQAPNLTVEFYTKTTERLISECNQHFGSNLRMDSMTIEGMAKLAQYMNNVKRHSIAPRSWKSYRFSVAAVLGDNMNALLISRSSQSLSTLPRRNASKRSNSCNREQLKQLTDSIRGGQSEFKALCINWLRAGTYTGLRPQEWLNASIRYFDGEQYLRTKTISKGKIIKNEHSEWRYIPLNHLNNEEVFAVRSLCDIMNGLSKEQYTKIYDNCRKLIQNYSNICFGNKMSIGLYSTRQQFSANLKKSKVDKSVIAMAMGHSSETTQRHHYAPAFQGEYINFDGALCKRLNEEIKE